MGEALRVERGGGGDGGRLMVLGGEDAVLELLLVVQRFAGGLDVHEGDGRARPRALVIFSPGQQFDTLHPSIPLKMVSDSVFTDVFGQISNPKMTSLSNHLDLDSSFGR